LQSLTPLPTVRILQMYVCIRLPSHAFATMDGYHTLATVLTSRPSLSLALTPLIVSQLSSLSTSSEQKAGLSRILAELLRSAPDKAADRVLRDYVWSLLLPADSSDASEDFKLVMEVASDGLLSGLLSETVLIMGRLLKEQTKARVSSDEGFAVDFSRFIETNLPNLQSNPLAALEEVQHLKNRVLRLLRFWHFVFLTKDWLGSSRCIAVTPRLAGEMLPAHLLGLMALRDLSIAMAARSALCQLLNDFPSSAQPTQVVLSFPL